jgi:ferredoxin
VNEGSIPETRPAQRGAATVDWSLCIGSGLCREASGGAFELVATPDGPRARMAAPDIALARLVAGAVACPTLAIRVVDADGREAFPADRGGSSADATT